MGIGSDLKRIREEKGLSIYDVEEETKIKAAFIEAIEQENFDKIPGRVYVKGFIKNYAKFLGLDSTSYLQRLNEHFQEGKEEDILANSKPQLVRPIREEKSYGKIMKIISLLLILAVLGFAGYKGYEYLINRSDSKPQVIEGKPEPLPEVIPVPEVTPKPEPKPDVVPNPGTPIEPAKPEVEVPAEVSSSEKIKLEVLISSGGPGVDSCWIQVISDGKLEFEETIFAGREAMIFTASKTMDFTYGNAAAINIKINGVDQGKLGAPGEVGTKRFKTDDL